MEITNRDLVMLATCVNIVDQLDYLTHPRQVAQLKILRTKLGLEALQRDCAWSDEQFKVLASGHLEDYSPAS